jgi:type II secretory pathway pseudopilin PulG
VRSQRGFGYLEVLFALVVLATAVSAAGLALQSHALGRAGAAELALARALVDEGLAAAQRLPLLDPESGTEGGLELGESEVDDLGDLEGWVEHAPRDSFGELVGAVGEWRREFAVERVAGATPDRAESAGAAWRIRVAALRNGRLVAEGGLWRAAER